MYWTHSLFRPLSLSLSVPATLSAVKSEIRARQSWMAPKHSLGLSGLLRSFWVSVSCERQRQQRRRRRRQRRLAGCAGAQFADSAPVVSEDAPAAFVAIEWEIGSRSDASARQSIRQIHVSCKWSATETEAVRFFRKLSPRCNWNNSVCGCCCCWCANESVSCD